jgi:hypothetical protein
LLDRECARRRVHGVPQARCGGSGRSLLGVEAAQGVQVEDAVRQRPAGRQWRRRTWRRRRSRGGAWARRGEVWYVGRRGEVKVAGSERN